MIRSEFLDLISRFSERPFPSLTGRHVYLWLGNQQDLLAKTPTPVTRTLDLHLMAGRLLRSPRSMDAARRLLVQTMRSQLTDFMATDGQLVIAVTGCDLLSRYRVPLVPFFEVASEQVMVVFVVPAEEARFQPVQPIPDYVSFDADAPFEYLKGAVGATSIINTIEE